MSVASTLSFWPMNPMYEFLLGVGTDGKEPTPQLATEWTLDSDGSSYRFKLRQGVKFHNNFGELTSKDVKYTWETMRDEVDPLRTPQAITVLNQIKDVETPGDYDAVMRLQKPDSGFLAAIGQAENVFPIFSKADGATRTRAPSLQDKPYAGTAPYQYLERQQSQYLRYQKIPFQHWRQMPDFPEFEWRFIREDSTRLSAILAREIHVAALPPDLVTQATTAGLKAIPGKAPGLHSFLTMFGVWMNVRLRDIEKLNPDPNAAFVFPNSPMMDVRVRKALNKAIDRDAMNKAFLRGKGETIYNEYFYPTRPGWNPAWERNFKDAYGYDPEAARKL
ncbi:MAG: ABC transporter substrate-binding protein, partial [Chloroflexota bacterium]